MTAPSIRQLNRTLAEVRTALVQLEEAYGWAYSAAYTRGVVGDAGPITRGEASDPTGGVVASAQRDRIRRALRAAHRHLDEATRELKTSEYKLRVALEATDPPPTADLRSEDKYRVSRDELAASRAAQDRRRDRGEHLPV